MRYQETKVEYLKPGDIWTFSQPPHLTPYVVNIVLRVRGDTLRCLRIENDTPQRIWSLKRKNLVGHTLYPLVLTKRGFSYATVDLTQCQTGQKLLTVTGKVLTYVRRLPPGALWPHEVRYEDGSLGSRTDDGYVFNKNRQPGDHDVIALIR